MDFEWLKSFAIAARTENFREVGRQRFINQATVSHHIANLEMELGVALFARRGRRALLTDAGREYLAYAERLLALSLEGQNRVATASAKKSEHVTLAASPYAAETVLPWLCRQLIRRIPQIDLEITVIDPVKIGVEITQGRALAGLGHQIPSSPALRHRCVFLDSVTLVVPPDGADWDQSPPSWEALIDHYRIIIQPSAAYWPIVQSRWPDRVQPQRFMVVDQLAVTKKLVAQGVGISVLPELSVSREVWEGRVLSLDVPWLAGIQDALYWITPRDKEPATALRTAEQILTERWPTTDKE